MSNTQPQLPKDVEERFNKKFWYIPKNDEEAIACTGLHASQLKKFIAQELARKDEEIERQIKKVRDMYSEDPDDYIAITVKQALDTLSGNLKD